MYNDLIPLHLQEELIQIGEDLSRQIFRVGDIIINIVDYVSANNMPYTKRDVWRAVGAFIGKSVASVRTYESLSAFYSKKTRREYEILSVGHFKEAMKIDAATEHKWRTVLDYAVDRIDVYGRPASIDELRKVFIYNSEPYEFDDLPIESTRHNPLDEFVEHLTSMKRIIELMPIPEHCRSELRVAFDSLESVIESLLVEV